MVKVIERTTGTEYKANRIEGGFEIFTLEGEKYKKLRESTFKKYFKVVGETVQDSKEESDMVKGTKKQAKPVEEKKATKKAAPKTEPVEELTGEKKEKMMSKIRKMLALASNNPSEEEGLAAALQAQKLMNKYNIHQDEVEWEEVKKDIDSIVVSEIGKYVLMAWRKQLAVIVGQNFRCKVYMHGTGMAFRGYKEDAKIAAEVFKSLYLVGTKLGKKEETRVKKEIGTGKGIYNSYIVGFLQGLEEGFGEQSTALMIVTPKEVEDEYKVFSEKFGTSKTKNLRAIDGEAYNKGKKDGKAAVKARQVEKKGA